MFGKTLVTLLLAVCGTVAASAANIIAMDLNFYSNNGGVLDTVGKLPDGVRMDERIRFSNPKLKGFAYPVRIDFDKNKSIELRFVVISGSGRLAPSLCGHFTRPDGKVGGKFVFKCTRMEFCDEPTKKPLPFTVEKWVNMFPPWGVTVTKGDIITVRAEFEAVK